MTTEFQYDEHNPLPYFGAALVAHFQALSLALEELAKMKGTADLEWFDDLSSAMIKAAKGTTTEQMPEEVDASAVRFGFQVLEANLKSIRSGLAEV